jgi:imidazolonepropionase-like amidohydrolase
MKFLIFIFCGMACWHQGIAQNLLIKNVTLIDTENGKEIPGRDVLVQDGLVRSVTKTSTAKTTANPSVIDGAGKYLMPGMADAHIHFFQSGSLYTRPDAVDLRKKVPYEKELDFTRKNITDYLQRYLRLGITTVIDVGGPFANFITRDSTSKTITAPNVLVTGPLFSMVENDFFGKDKPIERVTNIAEADLLFDKMMAFKPDFIKIWYIANAAIPAEKNFALVKHIADRTHAKGLKLTVHSTELKTAQLAVEAGADILVHSIDDAAIPDSFIQQLKKKNVTLIPTLLVGLNYYKAFSGRLSSHPQDLAWANAFTYGSMTDPEAMDTAEMPRAIKMLRKIGIPETEKKALVLMQANLKKLYTAGVNIAAGTDAGNIGTMHASSYLQELEAMQEAGLTVPDILKTATINVARGFGREASWGSIEKGKKADMVLLSKNPLTALQHLNSIEMIFKDGKRLMPDSILMESPEAIVQRQLNAYNARDIDAFLNTYSDDVELYDFPATLSLKGKAAMRKSYEGMFKGVSNLYCEIEKRIVLGNKIIDKEKVRAGNRTIHAIAVYEVENGKIKKVTFLEE